MEVPNNGEDHWAVPLLRDRVIKGQVALQQVIDELPFNADDKRLTFTPDTLKVEYINPGSDFAFRGQIYPDGFIPNLLPRPTAIIRSLIIPLELRGANIGSRIVATWEEALSNEGITQFAAVNIMNEGAVTFWRKLGYKIPRGIHYRLPDRPPYIMSKTVDKPSLNIYR